MNKNNLPIYFSIAVVLGILIGVFFGGNSSNLFSFSSNKSKEQKIKIVAEFVSELKILRYVKSIGIDYSQGYYIGKPEPIENIIGAKNEKYRFNRGARCSLALQAFENT